MTATLDAIADKPVALYQMDDTAPFQDYSGYNRAGTMYAGTQVTGIGLANGCSYCTVVSRANVARFDSPVFRQGYESEPFTLESWVIPGYKTEGYASQTYRENLTTYPSLESTTGYVAVSSTGTIVTDKVMGTNSFQVSGGTATTARMERLEDYLPPGTYTYSIYFKKTATPVSFPPSSSFGGVTTPDTEGTISNIIYDSALMTNTALNTWTRATTTFTINTAAVRPRIRYYVGDATVIFDAAQLEVGTVATPYFDGSMAGAEWVGTANASRSRMRADVSKINHSINPRIVNAGSPLSNNVWWTNAYNVTLPTSTPDGITTGYRSTVNSASAGAHVLTTYNVDGLGNLPLFRYLGYWVMTPHTGYEVASITNNVTTYTPLTANQWKWVNTETPSYGPAAIRKVNGATSAAVNDVAYLTGVTVSFEAPPTAFFDGNTVGAGWVGTASQSASVMYVSQGEQQILGNINQYDGLTISGTEVSFTTKYLTTGESRASYDLQGLKRAHVVGVHTTAKNMLYVNGELVAEAELSDAQQSDSFVVTDAYLYSGQSNSSRTLGINNVAVYAKSLTSEAIARHFEAGNSHVPAKAVALQYGGIEIPLSKDYNDVFMETRWASDSQWNSGYLENVSVEDGALIPMYANETSVAGTWTGSFPLDASGLTSIYGVTVDWDGEGATVQASLDGTTWETVERNKNLALAPSGFNPTDKNLSIRISFPGGIYQDESYVDNLIVTGLKTGITTYLNGYTVTYTSPASPMNEADPIELRDDWGMKTNGGIVTITPPVSDTVGPGTIEIWARNTHSGVSGYLMDARNLSATGNGYILALDTSPENFNKQSTAYMNTSVLSTAFTWRVGEWAVFHLNPATTVPGPIVIGQRYTGTPSRGKFQVGRVVLYENALTAAQIKEVYDSYIGRVKTRATDISTIGVSEPAQATLIYAYDWQITGSG